MTKRQLTKQIFDLCGGNLNGSHLTQKEFSDELVQNGTTWFSILLPDGWWLMQVKHFEWGWEYYIPDTIEQEKALEEIYYDSFRNIS